MNNVEMILQFIADNNVLWMLLIAFGMYLVGRSVPQEAIDKLKVDAAATDTPLDDALAMILDALNRRDDGGDDDAGSGGGGLSDALEKIRNSPIFAPAPEAPAEKLPAGIPLNNNWKLNELKDGRAYREASEFGIATGGRAYAVPTGYQPLLKPDDINGILSPIPDVHYEMNEGFKFALAHKAGRFGYSFDLSNWVLAGASRYALIVEYEATITPIDKDNSPTVYLGGALRSSGLEYVLKDQPITADSKQAQWLIETQKDYADLGVAIGVYMPWASVEDESYLTMKSIKFVPVVDGYGGNVGIVRI